MNIPEPVCPRCITEEKGCPAPASYKDNAIAEPEPGVWSDARERAMAKLRSKLCRPFAKEDIDNLREGLDESHTGLDDVKRILLSKLALSVKTGETPSPVLLAGAPGTGKTSILESAGKALGRGCSVIRLAGLTGSFCLTGSNRTCREAGAGQIASDYIASRYDNPVIIFDGVDKIGTGDCNGRICGALLDLLEKDRAESFTDNYLELSIDLSGVWVFLTANSLAGIPPYILDRCSIVHLHEYTFSEKKEIAKTKIAEKNILFSPGGLVFKERQLDQIVFRSNSVRNISKCIDDVFADYSLTSVESGSREIEYVSDEAFERLFPSGPAPGCGYSSFGKPGVMSAVGVESGGNSGLILPVEALVRRGNDELQITGDFDEGAENGIRVAVAAAENFLNAAGELKVSVNTAYNVRMEGGSASLAFALAVISAAAGVRVSGKTACTGTLSLKGDVLRIGMCAAKIRTASEAGYEKILIPKANKSDLDAIPEALLGKIEVVPVADLAEAAAKTFPLRSDAKLAKEALSMENITRV